jgi:hypothetical protein
VKPWKVQKFFGDLLYDLRSRNLLPVVLMLGVGIVAVPILISKGSSDNGSVGVGPTASAVSAPEGENAVVAYHPPGLRNLKQRLNDLGPKNPFVQQYVNHAPATGSDSSPALDSVTSTGTSSTETTTTGGNGNGGGGNGGNGGKGSGGGSGKTQTFYTYYQTNVSVGEAGSAPTQLNNLTQFQFLPTPDKPVLVYLGTASGGTQALFLVSKDVTSVGGTGTCFPTADACQLLGLNSGAGADLIYGPDGKTYHLQVTNIKKVTSSQPPG